MKTSIVASTVCLLLWIDYGSALSCYQCDSKTNQDCKEMFDHANMDTLTVKSSTCNVDAAAYCIKTTGVWGGVVGTTRFCSSRDMGNQCQFIRYPDHDRIYRACIYTCKGHHCNGSHRSTNTSLSTILSLALIVLLHQFAR